MFNRILIPLDGSVLAERVIPHAERFARIFGSSVVLLRVLEPTSYHESPDSVDPLGWKIHKAEADMYMHGVAARMRENLNQGRREKKISVEYSIREGKTAENIVDFAHDEKINLLAISTHGSGGLSRWNISSVTQKVINLIYLPVLIVRAYGQSGADEDRIRYGRILLPIDSSRRAEHSLSAGIALAQAETSIGDAPESDKALPHLSGSDTSSLTATLVLAAVIKPPELPIPEPYPVEAAQLFEQFVQVSRRTVRGYLEEIAARLPVKSETHVVEGNSVASAIQGLADQQDVDLVVLSAHGRTGQSTVPYGHVTRNYIEHGTKPVLVMQDMHRSQVRPTVAAIAAGESGRR